MTESSLHISDIQENELTSQILKRILKPNSNCIDIGANVGAVLKEIVDLAPQGKHFAFEPIPIHAARLQVTFPSVRVFAMAVSDTEGTSEFCFVRSNTGYSGLIQREFDRPEEEVEYIEVPVNTLDNMVPVTTAIDLIKIDVEGAELQVLLGAEQLLRRDKPTIIFEHGLGAANCYGTTPEMVFDYLNSLGYQIFLLPRWLAKDASLLRKEFCDAFYNNTHWYFIARQT